jgi:hypothetical protein
MTKRYTVYHSIGKRDGDAGFDRIEAARQEYDDQVSRKDVCEVELIDNANPDDPKTISRYDAKREE